MILRPILRVVAILTIYAFVGNYGVAVAANESKAASKEKPAPTAAQPGGGIKSIKASGADKVTKSRTCSGTAPKILKVTPDEGRTGDKITVVGENFGEAGCITGVAFGPGSPAKFTYVDSQTVTVVVPEGKKGLELLILTNSTGEDSKPFLRK